MWKLIGCLALLVTSCSGEKLTEAEALQRDAVRAELVTTKRGDLLIVGNKDGQEVWAVVSNHGGEEVKIQRSLGAMTEWIFPGSISRAVLGVFRGVCGKGQMPAPETCREKFFAQ